MLLFNKKFVKSWIYKKGLNFGRFTGSKVVKNVQKLNSGIDSCFEFEYSLKGIFLVIFSVIKIVKTNNLQEGLESGRVQGPYEW